MYRYSNGQLSLADFKQPVGMNLKESNLSLIHILSCGSGSCLAM